MAEYRLHVRHVCPPHARLCHAAQAEVDELERLIAQYQEIEEDEQGDLLDDFVLSATLVCSALACMHDVTIKRLLVLKHTAITMTCIIPLTFA